MRHRQHYNSNVTTQWFHTSLYGDMTPAESVQMVSDLFLDILRSKHLSISIPENTFRKMVCEATCSIRLYSRQGCEISSPHRKFSRPPGWNDEIESYWTEWLNSCLYTDSYWLSFWNRIPYADWEDRLPNWRFILQTILPYYVRREMEVLVKSGYIVENDDGDFVSHDDYETEMHLDYEYY